MEPYAWLHSVHKAGHWCYHEGPWIGTIWTLTTDLNTLNAWWCNFSEDFRSHWLLRWTTMTALKRGVLSEPRSQTIRWYRSKQSLAIAASTIEGTLPILGFYWGGGRDLIVGVAVAMNHCWSLFFGILLIMGQVISYSFCFCYESMHVNAAKCSLYSNARMPKTYAF